MTESDDLLARSRLIETVTGLGGTLVTLVKEIGSDALFGLLRVLDGEAREEPPGVWSGAGVYGPEAFDAVPYLELLAAPAPQGFGSAWGLREG